MIQIKRALEDCRRNEGVTTRQSADSESTLLEVAAEMGNSTAIALLCGARMRQPDVTPDDMQSGSELLTQLMDANFPLAFKVSGDLAVTLHRPKEALQFYERAIDNGLEDNRLMIECYRNIGHLAFKDSQLTKARKYFDLACMLAEDPKQVSDCHFMLAQLREVDRIASRRHLELSAMNGFHNAFIPLGTMLLNWFGEPALAREWFNLASVTDTTGAALVGLLDSSVKLEDWTLARHALGRIRARDDAESLLATREGTVEQLESKFGTGVQQLGQRPALASAKQRSGRFDF